MTTLTPELVMHFIKEKVKRIDEHLEYLKGNYLAAVAYFVTKRERWIQK